MAKTQILPVDLPRIDGDTQSRLAINEDVVDDYAELIANSNGEWPFPPLDVFHDGTDYYVADGFHRFLAAQRSKRGSFPCRVHKGTAKDARIFGMTANDQHGLRMSRADKRACIGWLLDNGGKMTQKEIAEAAGVSTRLVQTVVADRKYDSLAGKASPPKRDGKAQFAPSTPSRGDSVAVSGDDPTPFDAPETPKQPEEGEEAPEPTVEESMAASNKALESLARQITGLHKTAEGLEEPHLAERLDTLLGQLKAAAGTVRASKGYATCSYCDGVGGGCNPCRESGWLTKTASESAPRD